ncbi:MAG: hypothetical protein ABSB67_06440 [Bryobacteraceae bacterium]
MIRGVVINLDGVGEAVNPAAVRGSPQRGGSDLRREIRRRRGKGIGGDLGDRGQQGECSQRWIEQQKLGGGGHQSHAVGSEGDAERRAGKGQSLLIHGGEIDDGDEVGGVLRSDEVPVVGHHEVMAVGRHIHGTGLTGDIDTTLDRIGRQRHDIDAVAGEVGDIEHATVLVERQIGRFAADRNHRPEGPGRCGKS